MTTTIEPTQEQQAKIAEFVRHRMSEVDVADAGQVFDELRDTFKELAETAAEVDDLRVALDALTKRNAALLADKEDLSRQLRRVEEDRDNLAGFRDAVYATARSVAPDVDGGPVAVLHKLRDTSSMLEFHARDSQAEVVALKAKLSTEREQLWCVIFEKSPDDAPTALSFSDIYDAVDTMQDREWQFEKERDESRVEVAALKAKLAEVEAERDAARTVVTDGAPPIPWTMPLGRSWLSATLGCGHAHLSPDGGVVVRCMSTGHLLAHVDVYPHDGKEPGKLQHLHLSQQEIAAALLWSHRRSHHVIVPPPAGAGTEWAAPIAAAKGAPFDEAFTDEGSNGFVERAGKGGAK